MNNPNSIPTKFDAIFEIVGGSISGASDGTDMKYNSGQTPPSEKAIDDKYKELKAEYDAQAYSRNRKDEYPDWSVQLNKIYDDGLTKWKSEMIDPIKAKWPKDNSGPK